MAYQCVGVSERNFDVTDALGLYLFRSLDDFSNYDVVSVLRNQDIDECNAIIGAGDTFSPSKLRFSHNGRNFDESMSSLKIPGMKSYSQRLSTAGLVFAVYGHEILDHHYPDVYNNATDKERAEYFRETYDYIIEVIDCFSWGHDLEHPMAEKYKFMAYLTSFSAELDKELRTRQLKFVDIADIYSSKIGDKFKERLSWYFDEFVDCIKKLQQAIDDACQIEPTGLIAACDRDFLHVNVDDVIERVTQSVTSGQVLPAILIIRSKDKYRVECLEYERLKLENKANNIKNLNFHCKNSERLNNVDGLVYISNNGQFAIMKDKESAIQIAKILLMDSQYKGVVAPSRMMPTNEPSTSSREISHPKNEPSISSREIRQHTSPTKPLDEQRNNNVKQRRGQSRTDKLATDSVLRAVFNLSEDLQKFSFPVRPSGGQQTSGQANETVFVELESSTATLSGLTKALHEKYPKYWSYSLCYADGTKIGSNPLTESPDFWTRPNQFAEHQIYFCFIDNEQENTCTTDDESIYDSVDNCSERMFPALNHKSNNDAMLGVNLDAWSLPELLAVAIIKSNRWEKHLQITSVSSENCSIRIGSDAYSYEDATNYYTRLVIS
ncbi:MYG1 protein [Ditylenchus destructor]|uniref:MYG1 protein n=1 Tax=Ditylenchus destructor TaxID=166010 RepID=A0AAD4NAU8_9BILA|nr:MYG1 protein [Ditylenchus destructor]